MSSTIRFYIFQVLIHLGLVSVLSLTGCSSSSHFRLYEGASQPSQRLAAVQAPHYIQVVGINGTPLKASARLASSSLSTYSVLPGVQKLELRYHEIWPIGEDDHETVVSDGIVLTFDLEAGEAYTLSLSRPGTLRDARIFADKPEFTYSVSPSTTSNDVLDGTNGRKALRTTKEEKAQPAKPASVTPSPAVTTTAKQPPVVSGSSNQSAEDSSPDLENLKRAWRDADKEDRKAFRKWIVDH